VSGWPDDAVGRIAARQKTLIGHAQLLALGLGRGAINHAIRRKRLHPVHRSVHSLVAPEARPPFWREHAALLALGRGSILSRHAAAAAWRFRPPHTGPIDVTIIGRDAGRDRDGIRVHRAKSINPEDIRTHLGMRITSPALTLIEISLDLADDEVERAYAEGLALRRFSKTSIREAIARNPRGGARLKPFLAGQPALTRSDGERRLLALIRKAGLPEPETNVRLGRWPVDVLWRKEKVIVELDGVDFHTSPWAFRRDRKKDAQLIAAGYIVIRISGSMLKHNPEQVLVTIVTALTQRRAA
jgi:very-short-patch-repair endonuclease